MRNPSLIGVLALAAFGAACAHRSAADDGAPQPKSPVTVRPRTGDEPEPTSFKEMMALLEASPRTYAIGSAKRGELDPEATLAQLFPERVRPLTLPQVVTTAGQRSLRPWPVKAEADEIIGRAEVFFGKKDFAKAAEVVGEAARIDPENYWVWLYLGDCAHFGGDSEKALALYDRAVALNPYDYRVHFFRGSALVRLGKLDEARRSFARSLALKPRNPSLLERIRKDERLDFTVASEVFRPRVEVKPTEKGFTVRGEEGALHWLAYGVCKAMWLGEPEHRQRMTGDTKVSFTSTEERECIIALLAAYLGQRERNEVSADEGLDAITAMAKAGHMSEFILYEFGSRVYPQVVLTLPDPMIEQMVEFVDQHLFVPRREPTAPSKAKPRGGAGDVQARR